MDHAPYEEAHGCVSGGMWPLCSQIAGCEVGAPGANTVPALRLAEPQSFHTAGTLLRVVAGRYQEQGHRGITAGSGAQVWAL